ncbi:RHS repeat domain-containing protein [Actinosynnema sp. CS-041913]|uniref:RHS repeat domain-containing protein n=1 Tax=Actinosynnema sp. CS-041913 TaxID=3239917 RepID=UPI003D90CCA8
MPVLVAGLAVGVAGAGQAAEYQRLQAQQHPLVEGGDAQALPYTPDPDDEAARRPVPAPVWPSPGKVVAGLDAGAAKAGTLPVAVASVAGPADQPATVDVEVLSRTEAERGGWAVVLRLAPAGGRDSRAARTSVSVTVDYSGFRSAFGADYGNRLRLLRLPDCALSTPDKPECAGTPLRSSNDGTKLVGEAPAHSLLALDAAPEGSTGTFKATELKPSGSWEFGGSAGDFSWQYGMRTPPAVEGPSPQLELDYSAQSVDGQTAATNNQPSWVGEGFSFSEGFIERSYRSCGDDLGNGATNTTKTGDLCWFSDNAVLSLGGQTVELVRDDTTGTFHAKHESGMRVERKTGAANGDDDGEHWVVTDRQGTRFWFGRNRIPAWADGRAQTESTWTVPVFGNHVGEPCRKGTHAASSCTQAWRWNLDYVVDAHDNSMSLWYAKETNKYAWNADAAKATEYVRSGWLSRIDYGTRADAEFGAVPARVSFDPADRCEANCGTKNATTWKDVPWDLECTGGPCRVGSPTFWTAKRLAKVTTSVADGAGRRTVDSWTLRHSYPDPGDNTRAGLWLDGITHTGHVGGTLSMPEVTFAGLPRDNRVHADSDTAPPMKWRRVERIRNGTGGEIVVSYSDPECVAGRTMPAAPESNTLRCHPAYWTRTGDTEPKIDYFHKYVVTAVSQVDHTGGAPVQTTAYEYVGGAAWHWADDDGIGLEKHKTWNGWRGYQKLKVTEGSGPGARHGETLYFRGMDGDRLPGGGRRTVQVTDSEGGAVADSPGLEGRPREKRTFAGPGGAEISGEITDPWQSAPTATRTAGGGTVHARFVDDGVTRHRIALDGGRGHLRTRSATEYDEHGLAVLENDLGDEKTADDDQCTRTTYARDTGRWLIDFEARSQTYALSCDRQPTKDEEVVSDTRTSYDGKEPGAAPVKGDPTRTEEISSFTGGVPGYTTTSRSDYDVHGRVLAHWDARNAKTTTAYTPAVGGPVTGTAETNDLGHTTTTVLEPAWEDAVLSTTDPNGKVTSRSYDPLGRLTAVWQPGRAQGKAEPHVKHGYQFRADGPTVVTTAELHPDEVRYVTSTELYDGFLRARQTQRPGPAGRIVTDIGYDSAGRVAKANAAYPTSGAPGPNLFVALGDNGIPNQLVTAYDAADRPVSEVVKSYDKEQSRTTTVYGGDRIDVTPPAGDTATSTITDGRDRKVELRQYKGGRPTGDHDATKYTYTRKNLVQTVVDPVGNTWTYGYDLRGRQVSETDPDAGTTTTTYNDAGDETSVTDAKGRTLANTYDSLGRRTGLFEGSAGGVKRAEWTYDTKARGQAGANIRYQDGKAFTTEVTGYDNHYQPTGTKITIPETPATPAGKLAGGYEFKNTYRADGSLATSTYPGFGDMPVEVIEYGYDDLAKPAVLKSKVGSGPQTTYVAGTQYTNLGEPGVHTFATGPTGKLVETKYTYEPTGRLSATLTTKETGTQTIADVRQTYDQAGNITKIADVAADRPVDTQCFGYDHLRRMTESWTPASGDCAPPPTGAALGGPAPYWQSFRYDAIGNRTSRVRHATPKGDVETKYSYPPAKAARPHAVTGTTTTDNSGTRTAAYEYDETGNTTRRPGAAGEQTLAWDVEGNVVSATDANGTASYVDDSEGNRLLRSDAKGTTLFLSDLQVRFDKASGKVDWTRFYEYGESIVAQRTAAGVTWLVTDQQGTAQVAIDERSQEVTQRRQTPFGEMRGQSTAWPNGYGFQFGAEEPGGLTNVGVRQYDADTGRFTSVDPIADPDNPQQLHAYAYANNSPVSFSDPTGKWWGMIVAAAARLVKRIKQARIEAARRAALARHVQRIKAIKAAKRAAGKAAAVAAAVKARRAKSAGNRSTEGAWPDDLRRKAKQQEVRTKITDFAGHYSNWGFGVAKGACSLLKDGKDMCTAAIGPLEGANKAANKWVAGTAFDFGVWLGRGLRKSSKKIKGHAIPAAPSIPAPSRQDRPQPTPDGPPVGGGIPEDRTGGGGSPRGLGGVSDGRDVGGRQSGPR